MTKKLKLRKPVKRLESKEREKTQLELEIEHELKEIEEIHAQKESLYSNNVEIFEAMSELESREAQHLATIKRLAHSSLEPAAGLNMVTKKTARAAEGSQYVVEIQYKRAADFYDLRELPKDVLAKPGVVKAIDFAKVKALKDARCESALKEGPWQTPSVYVRKLEEATPPGGDPKWELARG